MFIRSLPYLITVFTHTYTVTHRQHLNKSWHPLSDQCCSNSEELELKVVFGTAILFYFKCTKTKLNLWSVLVLKLKIKKSLYVLVQEPKLNQNFISSRTKRFLQTYKWEGSLVHVGLLLFSAILWGCWCLQPIPCKFNTAK